MIRWNDSILIPDNQDPQYLIIKRLLRKIKILQHAPESDNRHQTLLRLYKDQDTGDHIQRVGRYVEALSKAMGLSASYIELITYSSTMHDIGKLFVHTKILNKTGRLTPDEFTEIKLHTIHGAKLLEGLPSFHMACEIALRHHERYDGSGYPDGISKEEIPLSARIVTICDVFDALVSKRCYKEAYSFHKALTIMEQESCSRFDPEIANIFFRIRDIFQQIYSSFQNKNDI